MTESEKIVEKWAEIIYTGYNEAVEFYHDSCAIPDARDALTQALTEATAVKDAEIARLREVLHNVECYFVDDMGQTHKEVGPPVIEQTVEYIRSELEKPKDKPT